MKKQSLLIVTFLIAATIFTDDVIFADNTDLNQTRTSELQEVLGGNVHDVSKTVDEEVIQDLEEVLGEDNLEEVVNLEDLDDDEIDYSDLDLDDLPEDEELTLSKKLSMAWLHIKPKLVNHLKDNGKLYIGGVSVTTILLLIYLKLRKSK